MPYGLGVNSWMRLTALVCVTGVAVAPVGAIEGNAVAPANDPAGAAVKAGPEAPAGTAATSEGHPYRQIALRNAFGIKPPPPPPPPTPPPTNPPVSLPIFLTGFSLIKGVKKAYLVVNRPGAKTPDYLTASEGDDFDGLKVLAIDPRKETVRVINGTTEATLNFKDNGMKASAAPAAPLPGPGAVPNAPGGIPQPRQLGAPAAGTSAGGPTIIGRSGGGGVIGGAAPAVADNIQPVEVRGRGSVITGGSGDATPAVPLSGGYTTPTQSVPVPVPRTRPAPAPPPLPGQ